MTEETNEGRDAQEAGRLGGPIRRNELGQFTHGTEANPGGVIKQERRVRLTTRIRRALMEVQKDGVCVADKLATLLIAQTFKHPEKMWPFLKEFIDRDEGRTDRRDQDTGAGQGSPEELAAAVRGFLAGMQSSVPPPIDAVEEDESAESE